VSDLLEHMNETIRRRGLLRRGQSLLVAVSGGVDSMVLLHALHELAQKNAWKISVAHLNHCLRGRSSDADERLVVRTAKKFRLPIFIGHADVKKFGRERKVSLEMAARTLRHDFLARTAARLKIKTIVLAHHADDQIELFFLRLLRGSGSEGLAGMKWKNPSPADSRIQLVRPLLDISKSALREFAAREKIPFREDASNNSFNIQRNRIRHELIPLLKKNYQPALDQTIVRVMEILRAESELIAQIAGQSGKTLEVGGEWSGGPASDFCSLPVAVQRRFIQLQLQRRKIASNFDLIENLRARPGQAIKVSPDLTVVSDTGGRLNFRETKARAASSDPACEIKLNGSAARKVFSHVTLAWRVSARKFRKLPEQRAGREFFDADKIGSRIVLRHWRPGDRFQPIGMKASVKLQDLFVNQKIPREQRATLIVAESAGGEIFWVEKLRISERFKLTAQTNRCLQWQWKRR
jgi:tRNA(Ile)-lysidine synthase